MIHEHHRRTLVFIIDHDRVLLGRKKRGFGADKWNGFGGKLHSGETLEAAARRELREESGITAVELEQRGVLTFTFANNLEPLEVHVFVARAWQGTPEETEEMAPRWFPLREIPYGQMWADDPHWLPLLLAGNYFRGNFFFHDTEHLARFEVKAVAREALPRHV